MSETPLPPGVPKAEASRIPETREATNPRERVIGAFNRTMDRMQQERDAILGRVRAEGPGFLTDHDRVVVLGYQYAENGAKQLTHGKDRLDDHVEGDKFPVMVQDRTTGQSYSREEGIPVGGLIKYLDGEDKRLKDLREQAMADRRFDDAKDFSEEMYKIWEDRSVLKSNLLHTDIALWSDTYNKNISADVKTAASLNTDGNLINYYQRNRVGTEAYLRSENPLIKELGGESQDENWVRAEQDILKDRRELEIPAKGVKNPDQPRRSEPETEEKSGGVIIEGKARETIEAALEKIGSGRERIKRFVSGLPRPGLKAALTLLGVAGVVAAGYLGRDRDALPFDQAARVTQPPERGVAMPESTGPSVGLAPQETQRSEIVAVSAGLKRSVEVDIPGRGKETLNVRILTGNEPDIFNVPATAPATPDSSKPGQPAISSADVRRVIENPPADDETAKLIRSYLDEDTFKLLRGLRTKEAYFRTKGPEGEKIKPDYASLKGWFDADWTTTALERPFQMRSTKDLGNLEQLKKDPAYNQAWRLTVANQLLQNAHYSPDIIGFLVTGQEIVDVVVKANNHLRHEVLNTSSLQKNRIPGTQP